METSLQFAGKKNRVGWIRDYYQPGIGLSSFVSLVNIDQHRRYIFFYALFITIMLKLLASYIVFVILSLCILSCNGGRPVTKDDQKIFADYFKFQPTPDIKNFNYFPDEMGIDASYWISFNCKEGTVDRIRERLELQQESQPQEGLIGGLNIEPAAWWDTAFIKKTRPFSRQKENLYWYLWYDKVKKKVYFLAFDT